MKENSSQLLKGGFEMAINMKELVLNCGIPHRDSRGRFEILCPNPQHNDKHFGSCVVYDEAIHCYACGAHMYPYTFLKQLYGKREAVKMLKEWGEDFSNFKKRAISTSELNSLGILRVEEFYSLPEHKQKQLVALYYKELRTLRPDFFSAEAEEFLKK